MTDKDPVEASALAGSAIAIALLDLLLQKNVITRDEALIILKEAQGVLKNSSSTIEGARVVGSIYERTLKSK